MDPAALGRYLRESREARELTLDEVVQVLRIRRAVLENFEQGNFNVDASPVQIRGLLRNYARHIGLDEDRVLEYYQSALDTDARQRRRSRRRETATQPALTDTAELVAPRQITDTPPSLPAVAPDGSRPQRRKRRRGSGMGRTLLTLLVAALAMGVIVFVALQILAPAPTSTEAIAEVLTPTTNPFSLTPSRTPIPTSTLEPTATEAAAQLGAGVQVIVEAEQRSFLRVVVDDEEQFAGMFEPGMTQTYDGLNSINMTVANAAGLIVTYNGTTRRDLGERGQQIELAFTSAGLAIATPANVTVETQPPTNTPPPSPTPLPLFPQETGSQADDAPPTDAAGPAVGEDAAAVPQQIPTDVQVVPQPTATLMVANTVAAPTAVIPATNTDTPTPTITASPTPTPTPTLTLTPTNTITPTPTLTPTATAILPLRATPANPTPTKSG